MSLGSALSGLQNCNALGVAALGGFTPTAPSGTFAAFIAHPAYLASDASHLVPCVPGDAIRWIKEPVTGTWHEQPTSGARLILRQSGSKYYAEGGTGRSHTISFSGWSGTNGTLVAGFRDQTTSGDPYILPVCIHDLSGHQDYFIRGPDNQWQWRNFRPTGSQVATGTSPGRTTAWRNLAQVSGSDYRAYVNGSQFSTSVGPAWESPTQILLNANGFFTGQTDIVCAFLFADSTSRAQGEAAAAALLP